MTPGYYQVYSPCVACGRVFGYNPFKVPSLRVKGVREPVCQDCINRANEQRRGLGLRPHQVLPGAYDPIPEEEFWF